MENKTVVIFRKFKEGSIIALFPMIEGNRHNYTIDSYMRVGQHSMADYNELLKITKPAAINEYASLKEELENQPYCYDFIVQKKAYKFYWD